MDIDFDAPLDYLLRIKSYYVGLGYGKPYEWAKLDDGRQNRYPLSVLLQD